VPITTDQANYNGNAPYKSNLTGKYLEKTVSVKELNAANPWGLRHMSGNVWEWVQDYYHKNPEKSLDRRDPMGLSKGADTFGYERVVRGCGWYNGVDYCRSADRGSHSASHPDNSIGFRLVRTL